MGPLLIHLTDYSSGETVRVNVNQIASYSRVSTTVIYTQIDLAHGGMLSVTDSPELIDVKIERAIEFRARLLAGVEA